MCPLTPSLNTQMPVFSSILLNFFHFPVVLFHFSRMTGLIKLETVMEMLTSNSKRFLKKPFGNQPGHGFRILWSPETIFTNTVWVLWGFLQWPTEQLQLWYHPQASGSNWKTVYLCLAVKKRKSQWQMKSTFRHVSLNAMQHVKKQGDFHLIDFSWASTMGQTCTGTTASSNSQSESEWGKGTINQSITWEASRRKYLGWVLRDEC